MAGLCPAPRREGTRPNAPQLRAASMLQTVRFLPWRTWDATPLASPCLTLSRTAGPAGLSAGGQAKAEALCPSNGRRRASRPTFPRRAESPGCLHKLAGIRSGPDSVRRRPALPQRGCVSQPRVAAAPPLPWVVARQSTSQPHRGCGIDLLPAAVPATTPVGLTGLGVADTQGSPVGQPWAPFRSPFGAPAAATCRRQEPQARSPRGNQPRQQQRLRATHFLQTGRGAGMPA